MAEKEKVAVALTIATKTCAAALSALSKSEGTPGGRPGTEIHGNSTGTRSDTRAAPLQTLLTDYSSLLSLVYASITKIALTLKPSDPTYSAALVPLRNVTMHVDALASCACSIDPDLHGNALAREIRWATEAVINALNNSLNNFLGDASDNYLIKTGAVHEAIERARSTSKSNLEATKKRWEADREGLNDCVKEVAEMIEEESSSHSGEEDDRGSAFGDDFGDDDGWGELGVSSSTENHVRASQEELARLHAAHLSLKLIHSLHKRVLSSVISRPVLHPPSISMLDQLLSDSNALLHAADEVVPTLYIPHDVDLLKIRLTSLEDVIRALRGRLICLGLSHGQDNVGTARVDSSSCEEVARRVSSMTLQADSSPQTQRITDQLSAKASIESKWFNICFTQIFKSLEAIKDDKT